MEIDPEKIQPDNIQEVIRLSELYLDGTIRFAIAADARAQALAGMFAGATTALAAGGLALLFAQGLTLVKGSLAAAALAASVSLFVGLWNAIRAVRPVDFNVAGNYLDRWNSEADLCGPISIAQFGQAKVYQQQIDENRRVLLQSTNDIERALQVLKWTPLVALAVGSAAYAIGYLLSLCKM
jgi:hypothetical protein